MRFDFQVGEEKNNLQIANAIRKATFNMENTKQICITIPVRCPSWNAILSMGHWQRAKAKKTIQAVFISALSASENASSIPIILAQSGLSTVSAMRLSFAEMSQTKSRSKSSKESVPKVKKSPRKFGSPFRRKKK